MDVCESVFPFVCNNPECNAEYDIKRFSEVLMLWGIIYLTDNRHNLIGMTCPDCHHTTVRKFEASVKDFSIEKIAEALKINYAETIIKPDIKYMVPFSVQLLETFSLLEKNIVEQDLKSSIYTVQLRFTPVIKYPEYIKDQLSILIYENSIPKLLEIENQQKLKVFPRIVDFFSFYKTIDYALKFDSETLFMEDKTKNNILISFMRKTFLESSEDSINPFFPESLRNLLTPNLPEGLLRDMDFSAFGLENEAFNENIQSFVDDFKRLRNRIDFELIFRDELAVKYAKPLYLKSGSNIWYNNKRKYSQYMKRKGGILYEKPDGDEAQISKKKDNTTLADLLGADEAYKDKSNVFIRKNDNWYVKFQGKDTTIKNNKRIRYLVSVLNQPGAHVNYKSLTHKVNKFEPEGALTDEEFKKQYSTKNYKDGDDDSNAGKDDDGLTVKRDIDLDKKTEKNLSYKALFIIKEKIESLLVDKLKAESENDLNKLESIDYEIKRIEISLKKYGARIHYTNKTKIRIKERQLSDSEKNAYKNISNNLDNAYRDFEKELPELERHLRQCIDRRPTYVVYRPQKSKTNKAITWYISW